MILHIMNHPLLFWSVGRRALAVLWVLLLTACSARYLVEQPDVIHSQAHSGGSIVGFSQSGDLLASGGWEGEVHVWKLPGGEAFSHWRAHQDSVNGLAFTRNDRSVVTAGYDGLLAEWTLGGEPVRRIDTPAPVTHMVARVENDRLITGHSDGSVRVWRLEDFSLLKEYALHRGAVKAVAIDALSMRYASSGADGKVFVWPENGPPVPLESPPMDAWTLVFSPDGRQLYGGSWFRLYRWDLGDTTLVTLPTKHHGIIKSIQFTHDGNELASISRQTDSSVYFLDPVTGDVTRRFQQHELCGAAITVSPRGRYLATTSDDASVRIWTLETTEAVTR